MRTSTSANPHEVSRFDASTIGALSCTLAIALAFDAGPLCAQLTDLTRAPNGMGSGIAKSLEEQIGGGRGDASIPGSSCFLIARDPFRSIRRGRQLFQRKFELSQGLGPRTGDGDGELELDRSIGAGLADSCAACHGRPRGAAGFGGDVHTRPDSRDAPHLFGLGLVEMLADEITSDLRAIRDAAVEAARSSGRPATLVLASKGIGFGTITAAPDGELDTASVEGVDADLRVRPFFAEGGTMSIREFVVGAFNAEMGLESADPLLLAARAGQRVVTPAGMVLDGSKDTIEAPPVESDVEDSDGDGIVNEIDPALIDFLEFYLLNYFKPGTYERTVFTDRGRRLLRQFGCTSCHVPDLVVDRDRRVADVETVYDPRRGHFNRLFATASARFVEVNDGSGHPPLKRPGGQRFLVANFFSDLKRHDLGPAFWEIDFDGSLQREFVTEPLWGVGSTAPYGHDGRSVNLREVILRHGGEARAARTAFARAPVADQRDVVSFLETLVLFPPDDTASNLNPGDPSHALFPQQGHGNIALGVLFNDPSDPE
jgi:hypothetical protein